jgi:hypothetical protein
MYFVAEKAHKTLQTPDVPGCSKLTVMTGWLVPDGLGQFSLSAHRSFITDCDRKGTETAKPLAAVRVSDRVFWVLVEHGYEDETFVVMEITVGGVHRMREAGGGGC